MRSCLPLLSLMACTVAQRPPPPQPQRFSLQVEQQRDPDLCRRMAGWECTDLDCPDCGTVAQQARARDVGEVASAFAALCLASLVAHEADPPARGATPFADALEVGGVPGATNGL